MAPHLSYSCRNEIHRYFGLEKRMALIKNIPALRKQNRKLEYHLTEASYAIDIDDDVYLTLDGTTISITENLIEHRDGNLSKDLVVEVRRYSRTVKWLEFKNYKRNVALVVEKMVAFYLDRPGTVVRKSLMELPWRHLQKFKNSIKTLSFSTDEHISTKEWWRELFGQVKTKKYALEYDHHPGVLSKIVKTVNSDLPIGTSVVFNGMKYDDLPTVLSLKNELPDVIVGSRRTTRRNPVLIVLMKVVHPGHELMIEFATQSDLWFLTITKRKNTEGF